MIIPIYCDICFEHIANAEREDLRLPLRGSMFKPRESSFPDPFPAEVDWEFMRCPFCRHRPFIEEHLIQVGAQTPGNRPVLDLTKPMEAEPQAVEAEPLAAMFDLALPDWQSEPLAEPTPEPLHPQAQTANPKRGKRKGRK